MRMLLEIVRQSLSTLWAHKLRSFLTMFGIAWGVGSLLLLVGLGEGFRSGQNRQLANLGQDIMFTFPGRIPAVQGSTLSGRTYHFTYADYQAVRHEARTLKNVSPVLNREDIRAVSDYGSTNGQVFGVAPSSTRFVTFPSAPAAGSTTKITARPAALLLSDGKCSGTCFPAFPPSAQPSCSTA